MLWEGSNDCYMYWCLQQIKDKMEDVLQSCANQQQISFEVYTEADKITGMKSLWSVDYTVEKAFKCDICNNELRNIYMSRKIHISNKDVFTQRGLVSCHHCREDSGNNTFNLSIWKYVYWDMI